MSISKKILTGGILFALIMTLTLSVSSYHRFNVIIMRNYERNALRTAQNALTFLDVEKFSDYRQDTPARQKILSAWCKLVDEQYAKFIYVIELYDDYNNIRFILDVVDLDYDYQSFETGHVMPTSSAEYKRAYIDLYERGKEYAVVMRDNGISETSDHITLMLPIKNSRGSVEGLLCVHQQMDELDAEKNFFLKRTVAAMLIVLAMAFPFGLRYLKNQLLNPLSSLTQGVKEISGGNLDKKLDIRTNDELQTLAESFNTMTDELKAQMTDLAKVTADRERIATELEVATRIQLSMLPKDFSVDDRVDICATMTPAKEVGGDLYDFYKLDENHLVITIADVSGKGVPAALFMVAAITNLRNAVATLQSPDDLKTAIENTNDSLCANNDGGLFVTAFSGVLDLTTGIFRYVNAGHNPPLIRHHGQNFEELPMELNFVLGGWEDWQYVQQEIQLEAGDTIFLYTDGVTEAADSSGKLYSLERLKGFLNKLDKAKSAEEILSAVRESLQQFSEDAAQADDITMLAVKLKGACNNGKQLEDK